MTQIKNPEKFEREGFKIYKELNPILSRAKPSTNLINFQTYFLDCIDPKTPSYERSLVKLIRMYFSNTRRDVVDKDLERFLELSDKAEKWLKSEGYRYGTRTAQEHRLGWGTVEERYMKDPYKPSGLISGHLTIGEAIRSRELEKTCGGSMGIKMFYNLPKKFNKKIIGHSLEPLDEIGRTTGDPLLLDENFKEIKGIKKTDEFPFRRG